MLSDSMLKELNVQITKEIFSSYLYLQMAAWFENKSLKGFSNWMKVQAQEEVSHAMILFNYVNERGGMVEMGELKAPGTEYETPLDVFQKSLAHEQFVTKSIHNLMDMAISQKDYPTQNRLEWFIAEQVEEEANASEIIGKLELIGESNGLFMLDKELEARVFTLPSPLAASEN